ncbi:DNA polymerase IV [Microvirga tunisiensis]|uniref:DNA polymerase IV n=1 Tax=Pannonibacter tanglangensis TaxID=2750084 RepID=A0A7X5J8M1_9HYPH|nr:DNA polymerase IV [Pannonibacter sp. XCT-53]NBN77400.1 DNA polymerase IV [Pannonibacter sp. XCT-53]
MTDAGPTTASPAAGSARSLCRDCGRRVAPPRGRCPACGSPRLVTHPDLDRLTIAHVDCDAFFASVEKRDNPALADVPVIVGGGTRGVVSTCCYIARIHGVRSAMPMFKALEACPEAVVIRPDMAKYSAVGRQIRERMLALTPLVEPLSIDEAFLDLSGTERLHQASPAEVMARFAREIERDIGVTVSVGLAPNKFLAKIASELDKPRGFAVIGPAEARGFLATRPVGVIWGVGKVFQARLAADGLTTIGQLQAMDPADLIRRYGSMGIRLARLCQGEDDRQVTPSRPAKSVSAETTFSTDLSKRADLRPVLRDLSEKVSARLKAADLAGRSVTLKLKTAQFRLITRSRQLADPTQLADRIFRAGDDLLADAAWGEAFRLIGIGVGDLVAGTQADPADLIDEGSGRRARAEEAMDRVREKFGKAAVETGLVHAARQDRSRS